MLRRLALARPDVPEERSASIVMMERIGIKGKTLVATSN
jgi:hypothetical protein